LKKKKVRFLIVLFIIVLYYLVGRQLCNNPRQLIRAVRTEELVSSLKTGDIIFTKAKNTTSLLQQHFFGSYVNHCAMIFRARDDSLWIWDTGPSVGAYMTPFHEFVRHNWLGRQPPAESPPVGIDISYINPQKQERIPEKMQSMLFVRRLAKPLCHEKVLKYIQENLGRPYSYKFWMSAINCVTGFQPAFDYEHSLPGYFCSELMMLTYAAANVVDLKLTPAASIMPRQFWMNEIAWKEGQTLLTAERLIGELPKPSVAFQEKDSDLWLEGLGIPRRLVDLIP
jgi:hypothetical protein